LIIRPRAETDVYQGASSVCPVKAPLAFILRVVV
jgi:hypothetical protein